MPQGTNSLALKVYIILKLDNFAVRNNRSTELQGYQLRQT